MARTSMKKPPREVQPTKDQVRYHNPIGDSIRDQLIKKLSLEEYNKLSSDWKYKLNNEYRYLARPAQIAPPGDWAYWLICAGRSYGKSWAGSNWIINEALDKPGRYIVVGRTVRECKDVNFTGDSGILAMLDKRRIPITKFNERDLVITFPNKSEIIGLSSEVTDGTAGKNLSGAWFDEFSLFYKMQEYFDIAKFAIRKGNARTLITCTPRVRANKFLRQLMVDPDCIVTTGSSYANIHNLAPIFRKEIDKRAGTRIGRSEIFAELLDDSGDLFKDSWFQFRDLSNQDDYQHIVIGFDPAVSSKASANESGIVACAKSGQIGYVLADYSCQGSPNESCNKAIEAYHRHNADYIVVECNQGGDYLPTLINSIDPKVRVRKVVATKSKIVRAQPIAALYEQHRIIHNYHLTKLEQQLITFENIVADKSNHDSPDRAEAMIWALTYLFENTSFSPFSTNNLLGCW